RDGPPGRGGPARRRSERHRRGCRQCVGDRPHRADPSDAAARQGHAAAEAVPGEGRHRARGRDRGADRTRTAGRSAAGRDDVGGAGGFMAGRHRATPNRTVIWTDGTLPRSGWTAWSTSDRIAFAALLVGLAGLLASALTG